MKTMIPIVVTLEDIEWHELRDALRSAGQHAIWSKIVHQYEKMRDNEAKKSKEDEWPNKEDRQNHTNQNMMNS